jgi:hypothetical protein
MARRAASPTAMELLVRVLGAIGPYRDSVVLVGGFARDLYRYHEAFADPGLVGAETNDVDLATDDPLRLCGDQSLHDLLVTAGLRWRPQVGLAHRTVARVEVDDLRHEGALTDDEAERILHRLG